MSIQQALPSQRESPENGEDQLQQHKSAIYPHHQHQKQQQQQQQQHGEVSSEIANSATGSRVEAAPELATEATTASRTKIISNSRIASGRNNSPSSTAATATLDARGASPQGAATTLAQAATPRPPRSRRRNHNHNGIDNAQVKTERLTPDNNSTSSRSVTPLSIGHPATPPSGSDAAAAAQQPHLKHMEQMMGRNYSDFMRSLAAKYNNSNPNDYFSSTRNGYPASLDPRFPGFKSAAATPFVSLMGPLGATSLPQSTPQVPKEAKEPKQPEATAAASAGAGLFGSPANLFPPMLDMSSTQALLHMVRTANAAQNAAELESYLKGANKRSEAGLTSPLDLSSPSAFAPRKRGRTSDTRQQQQQRPGSESPKPSKVPAIGPTTPLMSSSSSSSPTHLHSSPAIQATTPGIAVQTPSQTTTPRPASPPPVRCPSLCGHMPCGDGQSVNRWTVEDVVSYVSSIDICAEYAQKFREHRIDGASLPLLSEEHLTGPMGMKLGPALKLRVLLARKLGACTVCLHCAHCHQSPLPGALSAAAAVAAAAAAAHAQQQQQQQQTQPGATGRRPSATSVN